MAIPLLLRAVSQSNSKLLQIKRKTLIRKPMPNTERVELCPVCGEPKFVPVMTQPDADLGTLEIVRCAFCNITFLSKRLQPEHMTTLEDTSDVYVFDETSIEQKLKGPYLELITWLEQLQPKHGQFLDIGCNRGFLLEAARRNSWSVVGIEISPIAANYAQQKFGLDVRTSLDLLTPLDQFDLAAAWHVLEHTTEPILFLRQISQHMADEGILAIQVPDFNCLEAYRQRGNSGGLICSVHNFYFTKSSLEMVIELAGLRVVSITEDPNTLFLTAVCAKEKPRISLAATSELKQQTDHDGHAVFDSRETENSLDYDFLRYIGVSSEGEAAIHGYYLSFMRGRHKVLDLGCGMGGFVKLLCEAGHDAYGVDSDAGCIGEARQQNLPVVEADVIEHLRTLPPATLDVIFSAHMVEHMPYAVVMETIQLSYRALRPGGLLLLVTPNPRALVSHLELYPKHFGHIAMYHPDLLSFFMHQAGFVAMRQGENPNTMAANIASNAPIAELQKPVLNRQLAPSAIAIDLVLPQPSNWLRKIIWRVKMGLVHWLVQPYFDRSNHELHQTYLELGRQAEALSTLIAAVDRPFECYVIGKKSLE